MLVGDRATWSRQVPTVTQRVWSHNRTMYLVAIRAEGSVSATDPGVTLLYFKNLWGFDGPWSTQSQNLEHL